MTRLYSRMKIFHFKDKVDSLPASVGQILPPVHVRIKPTNICGHHCSYCAYKSPDLQLGKDMVERDTIPREKMLEIIDDLDRMGVGGATFSGGGDPFYYPYLLDAAERLVGTKLKFAALTNGSRLFGAVAEVFARKATWLRISIDGWDDESYSQYRGVKHGEFTRVLSNMEEFKKIGGSCYLGVSLIVDHRNASHVAGLVGRLKDAGADSVKISPCIVSNSGAENNKYHQDFYGQVKKEVGIAKGAYEGPGFEIYDSYHLLDEKFAKDYKWCPYLQVLPVIGADLNVYSCQDKAYNLDSGLIGSIKDISFEKFWLSGKEKFFQINPSLHCGHHCVANEKNRLLLDYFEADPGHLEFV
jgi:MoaA/NifB/PqqE/SkfB family radical SAM enzyme